MRADINYAVQWGMESSDIVRGNTTVVVKLKKKPSKKNHQKYPNPLTSWKYKAGVEMTFQKKVKTLNGLNGLMRWIEGSGAYQDRVFLNDRGINASYDPDCIEAPTCILKSWGHAKQEIDKILSVAKERKLIAKNEGISTGGGGHVHVSGMKTLVKIAIQRDMQNRPYVPWFFADPDTTTQCNSARISEGSFGGLNHHWDKIVKHPTAYTYQCNKFIHTNLHYHYGTVEFRFFDCFMNWEQYEESLAFAQAYCKWIAKKVEQGKRFDVKIRNREDVLKQYNDYDKCLKEFKELIENIGLPWNRYKKYIANLKERFTCEALLT